MGHGTAGSLAALRPGRYGAAGGRQGAEKERGGREDHWSSESSQD